MSLYLNKDRRLCMTIDSDLFLLICMLLLASLHSGQETGHSRDTKHDGKQLREIRDRG